MCAGWVLFSAPSVFAQAPPSPGPSTKQVQPQKNTTKNRATQALFKAIYENDISAVKTAIAQGANINARDSNDTQPVDIAIDRGYFGIAHILISITNQRQVKKEDTFSSPLQPDSSEIESIPNTRNTAPPSAAKRFFSTFMDFFKPPNTTGIVERPGDVNMNGTNATHDAALQKRIQDAKAKRAAAAFKKTKPSIKNENNFRNPPTSTTPTSTVRTSTARGLPTLPTVNDTSPQPTLPRPITKRASAPTFKRANPANTILTSNRPFNGGVDPDILTLLATSTTKKQPAKQQTTKAATPNPFALPAIAPPRNVATLKAKRPPPRDATDPFATSGKTSPFDQSPKTKKPDGWNVKSVTRAKTPQKLPALSDIKAVGVVLNGVDLKLGLNIAIGQKIGKARLKTLKEKTIYRPCFSRNEQETIFCVDKINWPFDMEKNFQVDTIMYQGTRAIARYDADRATKFFTLFKTKAFAKIVGYYTNRYAQPTKIVQRSIAPLAAPRRDNPTYIWKSREPGTDTITILEIRKYDDVRDGFPDTEHGVIMLYRAQSGRIFPQLSQLELMVMRDNGPSDQKPKTPGNIWNAKP